MHLSLFYAVLVAFVCVAVLNYYLCTALLFKHKAFWNSSMEVVMYMITLIIMGGLDFSVTYLWILIGGGQLTAKLIACVVGLIGNFVLRKYLVFPIRHFRKSKI